jgi:hypothetical protein
VTGGPSNLLLSRLDIFIEIPFVAVCHRLTLCSLA